jgi:truncated hemoglobin YjbI
LPGKTRSNRKESTKTKPPRVINLSKRPNNPPRQTNQNPEQNQNQNQNQTQNKTNSVTTNFLQVKLPQELGISLMMGAKVSKSTVKHNEKKKMQTTTKVEKQELPVIHMEGTTGQATSVAAKATATTTPPPATTTTRTYLADDDGYLASVEASRELIERGQEIHDEADRRVREDHQGMLQLMKKPTTGEINRLGGTEPFLEIFTRFYEHLHTTPVLRTLFNESPEERTASEHGQLLGSFVLQITGYSRSPYSKLMREGKGHGLGYGHSRAKSCPHRPSKHQGRGFTWDQAHAWLGCMDRACRDRGAPDDFRDTLVHWLSTAMKFYGPMIHA